ncbi:MAG TPA: hypothetical protein VLF18_01705 [Tahibacter sp.]|uniref:hypothetical protein n=1 Tax=Tahibacter sp. TaxID=2056211 RepID=UPI002C9F5B16|nr:hypothetical protein [Tahibacter sp.]HSX58890.1 hypothetical protein [Tahibacter sp.]
MSDRPTATDLSADALTRALRDLPSATPPADGWATLAASLRSHGLVREDDDSDTRRVDAHPPARRADARDRRLPRRPWLAVGIAAALALVAVALVPGNRTQSVTPPGVASNAGITPETAVSAGTAELAELTALRGESGRIEEWLRTLKADETPLDGRSLMAATEIEDMIGLVDLQLAAGNDAGSDTLALWRDRVELLRDLAAVRTTYSLAGNGVAANGSAAAPDNWTHL